MSKNKLKIDTGFGLSTVLFLIFLTLKLGEFGQVQYWSWWWVTAPLWIPVVGVFVTLFLIGFIDSFNRFNKNDD